ncbi:PQQ-binding-like beta-propeller repeat protein [Nocardia sp. NPDC058176]|uniref:outer membrane protein assembly factor BamB family protein n=1 Tax=Nocardia sp. NPDC058176 TaxID=3346368 RepID=UPI0036D9BD48
MWSRFGTEDVALGDWHRTAIVGVAERVALTGAVVGAIVAVGLVVLVVLGRRPDPSAETDFSIDIWIVSMIVLVVGAMLGLGEPWNAVKAWSVVRGFYPFSPRPPMAAAAYLLAGVALLPAIIGAIRIRYGRQLPLRVLGCSLVAGLLVSTAAAVGALRLGDDNTNIDRSTAGSAEALAVPARVSGEAFRFVLDRENFSSTRDRYEIVATTAGFVIGTKSGIIAYDGLTGEQRWHYQRSDQGSSSLRRLDYSLLSTDGGDVVVTNWEKIGTVAFDATTGETLWTAKSSEGIDDFDLVSYPWVVPSSAPRPLLRGDGVEIAAFEPRTGRRLWLSDTSVPYCSLDRTVMTSAGLYQVRECRDEAERPYWSHITAIHPETGNIIATREFGREPAGADSPRFHDGRVVPSGNSLVVEFPAARRDGDPAVLVVTEPDQLADAPLLEVAGLSKVLGATGDGAELLAGREWPSDRYAITSHLVSVAEAAMGPVLSDSRVDLDNQELWSHSIFLTDQLVQLSHADGYRGPEYTKLRTWDRAGIREEPIDIPVDWPMYGGDYWYANSALIPVNGSLLLVLPGEDGSLVIIGIR